VRPTLGHASRVVTPAAIVGDGRSVVWLSASELADSILTLRDVGTRLSHDLW